MAHSSDGQPEPTKTSFAIRIKVECLKHCDRGALVAGLTVGLLSAEQERHSCAWRAGIFERAMGLQRIG